MGKGVKPQIGVEVAIRVGVDVVDRGGRTGFRQAMGTKLETASKRTNRITFISLVS